jgi:predicted ATPase
MHPHNLPIQLTSFMGREREMSELGGLLSTTRLLTVTGAGGIGKTRVSLHVTAEALERFPNGLWLAELASPADPALVPPRDRSHRREAVP